MSKLVAPDDSRVPYGIAVVLAYHGGAFAGWQHQPGQRTVQGVLAKAVAQLSRHHSLVRGASRTDAGVHAEGQVAAFATDRQLSPDRWVQALNPYLPADMAVISAFACRPDYDPRFDARKKTYEYRVFYADTSHPMLADRVWHIYRRRLKQQTQMQAALDCFLGQHDFAAYRSARDPREHTVRSIHQVQLKWHPDYHGSTACIRISGDGFLHNMVRIMVGTVVEVGLAQRTIEEVQRSLRSGSTREQTGMTAPAHGLVLKSIELQSSGQG